jgi:hypothetical protein
VTSFERAFPLADNFSGTDAEYLQRIWRIETPAASQQQLISHLQQNAQSYYENVYLRDEQQITNSIVSNGYLQDEAIMCYTNDPIHGTDDWWALDMLCLPDLYCEQTADSDVRIAFSEVGY